MRKLPSDSLRRINLRPTAYTRALRPLGNASLFINERRQKNFENGVGVCVCVYVFVCVCVCLCVCVCVCLWEGEADGACCVVDMF